MLDIVSGTSKDYMGMILRRHEFEIKPEKYANITKTMVKTGKNQTNPSKKSRIQETLNLSTDADRSTDTIKLVPDFYQKIGWGGCKQIGGKIHKTCFGGGSN